MPQVEGTTAIQDVFVVFGLTMACLLASSAWLRLVNGKTPDRYQWEFLLKSAGFLFSLFLTALVWSEFDKFKTFAAERPVLAILIGVLSLAFAVFAFTFNSDLLRQRQKN
jgi:hypothetical protein